MAPRTENKDPKIKPLPPLCLPLEETASQAAALPLTPGLSSAPAALWWWDMGTQGAGHWGATSAREDVGL